MLKPFEYCYLACEPFLPPLYGHVRHEIARVLASRSKHVSVLDVGGRKSHYTIGLPASITISDLPRVSELQRKLNLGTNTSINGQTASRRSNLKEAIYDDMTATKLPENGFDIVLAVEVLEHVEDDGAFLRNVHRVLKPSGVFIMTTPNGDFVANTNPDHKRHYRRNDLHKLLESLFPKVHVRYGIRGGRFRRWGLKSWSALHPVQTTLSLLGNMVNRLQSARPSLADSAKGTHHLFARCQKSR